MTAARLHPLTRRDGGVTAVMCARLCGVRDAFAINLRSRELRRAQVSFGPPAPIA